MHNRLAANKQPCLFQDTVNAGDRQLGRSRGVAVTNEDRDIAAASRFDSGEQGLQ